MKKEVGASVFALLVLLATFFTVYYLNVRTTGFAVFDQNTQTAFDEGTYASVAYDSNASAVILGVNQTSGIYTSKIFDSNDTGTAWNNLTWTGQNVTFEVRNCSTANCSDSNFTAAGNLNNLNLTSRYFQYRTAFDSANDTLASVAIDYSVPVAPVVTSLSIIAPSGTVDSRSNVPVQLNASGTGIQCWYNVQSPDGTEIIANTTLSACANAEFEVSSDGDYVLTAYANGSSGFASQNSSFLVSTSAENEPEEEEEPVPVEELPPVEVQAITEISLGEVLTQEVIQGSSKDVSLSVQNSGTVPLTACKLSGDDSGLLNVPGESKDLGAGANSSFGFMVNVPDATPVAAYTLSLTVTCTEMSVTKSFTTNVLQKKLDFNITNVQRTRQNRVSVDYILTELAGEDQDIQIYFSIKDSAGTELANASQNRSIDANGTDDFRTNIAINESLNGTMTLSAAFNSQAYSSSVLEPIDLSTVTGGAIFGGVGAGGLVVLVIVVAVLAVVFFVARRMRKSGKLSGRFDSD